jgi:hypothetical protein
MQPFFELEGLASGSSVVLETREAALAFPRGDLVLAFCPRCGFIANLASVPRWPMRPPGTRTRRATPAPSTAICRD